MKRQVKFIVEGFIVFIAFGAAVFSQRVAIADWIAEQTKPALPAEVSFEEVQTAVEEDSTEASVRTDEELTKEPPVEVVELGSNSETVVPVIPVVTEPEPVSAPSPQPAEEKPLPLSVNLAVPFTSQAPYADWSMPFQEACEEASLFMVDTFYQGKTKGVIPPDVAKEAILKIVDFENELFGTYLDTTAQQTATLIEMMYGYDRVEVIDQPTIEDIKRHLAQGRPVIVPAAGRLLHNPNFQQPGPVYHMFVIRGYTEDGQFITNDPGTRKGQAYVYDFDTVMNAMHDWNGLEHTDQGAKRVVVMYPN